MKCSLIVTHFAVVRSHFSLLDDNNDNNDNDILEEDIDNLPDFKLLINAEISNSCQRDNLKNMNN